MTDATEDRLLVAKYGSFWSVAIASGPNAGTMVATGFKTKAVANARADELEHLPWEQLNLEPWAVSSPDTPASSEPIMTVATAELDQLRRRAWANEQAANAYHRVGLHIDLHTNVTQSDWRAALADATDVAAGDPWEAVEPQRTLGAWKVGNHPLGGPLPWFEAQDGTVLALRDLTDKGPTPATRAAVAALRHLVETQRR